FTAWIFSFEENLAIKNAPPIVRLCLTIGVHFILIDYETDLQQYNQKGVHSHYDTTQPARRL
ncbi:hypothetical protein ACQKIW_31090, partial [Bacillus thuringiensis]|uniref:hypothetical protein n=1 Tax=Bacillus thuringiensis TaxID=1428 RepID=UPI003D051A82